MASNEDRRSLAGGRANDRSRLGKYIGLAALEDAGRSEPEEPSGGGLDFGITAWHLRLLCDNPWNGGGGYSPQQVAEMTPEQVWFRLCDSGMLKEARIRKVSATTGVSTGQDGRVKGRAVDGSPLNLPLNVGGKSLAARLAEQEKQKQAGRRRRRRGS